MAFKEQLKWQAHYAAQWVSQSLDFIDTLKQLLIAVPPRLRNNSQTVENGFDLASTLGRPGRSTMKLAKNSTSSTAEIQLPYSRSNRKSNN
jgi:hypothetical protein